MPNRTVAKKIDLRIASAIAVGTWRELREELLYGTRSDYTVTEYADHYLEVYCKVHNKDWKRKQSSLKHVKRLFGEIRLRDIEMRHVHQFVAARLKEEVKAATVNRDVTVLRHMFEFAVDEGVLKQNPIARIKKLKEYREDRPRINEKDLQSILKQLPWPVKQIVLFIYETGCRPSEALALKREHVHLENKTAIFNIRKAGDNALVALTSRAVAAIQEVPELPGCPYVFWNIKTNTRYRRINETFSRARKKAGLEHIQLKDFRRELAIVIAESGQPLHVAQTQLGHSSIRTTEEHYAKYSPEFAINRAREVMETRGRQMGDTDPKSDPPDNPPQKGSSNLVDFQAFKEGNGGGGRIRTAE
ncbi:MAG: site-specific integrase [Acidobacteria bacterium]|nr:site-specific integrase [Acidobacteriota bacterium]